MRYRVAFVLVLVFALLALTPSARSQATRTMRVHLLSTQALEHAKVEARGGAVDVFTGAAASRLLRMKNGDTVTLSRRGEELHLTGKNVDLFALNLQFVPAGNAAVALHATGARPYPGTVLVAPSSMQQDALRLINRVDLETYVASVLGSEYGLKDEAGTEAMAVAVRTYALRSSDHSDSSAYDLGDQVWSQRYEGADGLSKATLRAARATRGKVLSYKGRLIEASYFSSSGGHTANNEDVWKGTALPYLRGKPDPYDEAASPHIPWTKRLSRKKLLRALSNSFAGQITGFIIRTHSPDGRVKAIELLRAGDDRLRVRGSHFRNAVNQQMGYKTLLSTLFEAERKGSHYVFQGKGFGHGVGLSQWGAHEMAKRGYSYKDILHYYYTDVTLTTLDAINQREAAPPVAQVDPNVESPNAPTTPSPSSPSASAASASSSPTHPETKLNATDPEPAPPSSPDTTRTPPLHPQPPSSSPKPSKTKATPVDTTTSPSSSREKENAPQKRIGW